MTGLASVWDDHPAFREDAGAAVLEASLADAVRDWSTPEDKPRAMVEYQCDPISWAVEVLEIPEETLRWSMNPGYDGHEWDGTKDPLVAVADALADWKDVGVESGTGTGKSFFLAVLTLWFLACFEDSRVYTYAPKEDQLRLYMWAEISDLFPRFKRQFPTAHLTDLRIRMFGTDKWSAHGYSVKIRADEESATAARGAHAEHMLLIIEEGPGVEKPVYTAIENTATAPHNLRIAVGNPDHEGDPLHGFCQDPGVVHIRMSALDAPNYVTGEEIVPGAIGRKSVDRRARKYGKDHRLFLSMVQGISPRESAEAMIRWAWCEAAAKRYMDPVLLHRGLPGMGVDVANSEDGDKAAVAKGIGAVLIEVPSFPCPDSLKLAAQVALEMDAMQVLDEHCGVDGGGIGGPTINKFKELGKFVVNCNGGFRPVQKFDEDVLEDENVAVIEEEVYYNLRAQMWWQMRMDLFRGRVALPYDEELFRDLVTPKWEPRKGKIIVEEKEEIRANLGRSPDKGDAAVIWNWVRRRPPVEEEAPDISAWDPSVLEHEATESRKVRNPPARAARSVLETLGATIA